MNDVPNYVQIPNGFIVRPQTDFPGEQNPPYAISLDDAPEEEKKKHPQNQNPYQQTVKVPGSKDIVDMSGDLISDKRIWDMYNSIRSPKEVTSLIFQRLLDSKRNLEEERNKTVESYMTPMPVRELFQFNFDDVERGTVTPEEMKENNIDIEVGATTPGPTNAAIAANVGNIPKGNGGSFTPINLPKAEEHIKQSTDSWLKIVADTGASKLPPGFSDSVSPRIDTMGPDSLIKNFKESNHYLRDPLTVSNPQEREMHLAGQLMMIESLRERYIFDLADSQRGFGMFPTHQDAEDVDYTYFTAIQGYNPDLNNKNFDNAGEAIDYLEAGIKMNYEIHLEREIALLNPQIAFEDHAVTSFNKTLVVMGKPPVDSYEEMYTLVTSLLGEHAGGSPTYAPEEVNALLVTANTIEDSRAVFLSGEELSASAQNKKTALTVYMNNLNGGSIPPATDFGHTALSYLMPDPKELGPEWAPVRELQEDILIEELYKTMRSMSSDPSSFSEFPPDEEKDRLRQLLRGFTASGSLDTNLFNSPYFGTVLIGTIINASRRQEITGGNPILSTVGKHFKNALLLPAIQRTAWMNNPNAEQTHQQYAEYTTALFNLWWFDRQSKTGKLGEGFTAEDFRTKVLDVNPQQMDWIQKLLGIVDTISNKSGDGTSTDVAKSFVLTEPPGDGASPEEIYNYEAIKESKIYQTMADGSFLDNARDMAMLLMVDKNMDYTNVQSVLDTVFRTGQVSAMHKQGDNLSYYWKDGKGETKHINDLNVLRPYIAFPATEKGRDELIEELGDMVSRDDIAGWGAPNNESYITMGPLKIVSDWIESSVKNRNAIYHYIGVRINDDPTSIPTVLEIVNHVASLSRNINKQMVNGQLVDKGQVNNTKNAQRIMNNNPDIINNQQALNHMITTAIHDPSFTNAKGAWPVDVFNISSDEEIALLLSPDDPTLSLLIGGSKVQATRGHVQYQLKYNTEAFRKTFMSNLTRGKTGEGWNALFSQADARDLGVDKNGDPVILDPYLIERLTEELGGKMLRRSKIDMRFNHNDSLKSFGLKDYVGNLMMMLRGMSKETANLLDELGLTETNLGGRLHLPETASGERIEALENALANDDELTRITLDYYNAKMLRHTTSDMITYGPPSNWREVYKAEVVENIKNELEEQRHMFNTQKDRGTMLSWDGKVVEDDRDVGLYRFDSSSLTVDTQSRLQWGSSTEPGVGGGESIALPMGAVNINQTITEKQARNMMSEEYAARKVRNEDDSFWRVAPSERPKAERQSTLWNYSEPDLEKLRKQHDEDLATKLEELDFLTRTPDSASPEEIEDLTDEIAHIEDSLILIDDKQKFNHYRRNDDFSMGSTRSFAPLDNTFKYSRVDGGPPVMRHDKSSANQGIITTTGRLTFNQRLNLAESRLMLDTRQKILDAKGDTEQVERIEIEALRQAGILEELRNRQGGYETHEEYEERQIEEKTKSVWYPKSRYRRGGDGIIRMLPHKGDSDEQDFTTEGAQPENHTAVPASGMGNMTWMIAATVMGAMPNTANLPPEEYKQWLAESKTVYSKHLASLEGLLLAPKRLFNEEHRTVGIGHYLDGSTRSRKSFKRALPNVSYDLVHAGQKALTKEQAQLLFNSDIVDYINYAVKLSPKFETYSSNLRKHIVSATYRGSWGGSPKTRQLLQEGKFEEASKEFLNNDEYRAAKKPGSNKRGVALRMEAVADAILDEKEFLIKETMNTKPLTAETKDSEVLLENTTEEPQNEAWMNTPENQERIEKGLRPINREAWDTPVGRFLGMEDEDADVYDFLRLSGSTGLVLAGVWKGQDAMLAWANPSEKNISKVETRQDKINKITNKIRKDIPLNAEEKVIQAEYRKDSLIRRQALKDEELAKKLRNKAKVADAWKKVKSFKLLQKPGRLAIAKKAARFLGKIITPLEIPLMLWGSYEEAKEIADTLTKNQKEALDRMQQDIDSGTDKVKAQIINQLADFGRSPGTKF